MEPDGLDFEALKKLGLSNADVDFVREKTLVYNQLITGTVTVTHDPASVISIARVAFQHGIVLGIAKAKGLTKVGKKIGF